KRITFKDSEWNQLSLSDCTWDVRCDGVNWTTGVVSSSRVTLSGQQIRLSSLEAIGAQVTVASDSAVIADCSFRSSVLRTSGPVRLIKLQAHDARFYARAGSASGGEFVRCAFVDCVVAVSLSTMREAAADGRVECQDCSFVRTVCLGITLRTEELERLSIDKHAIPMGFVLAAHRDQQMFRKKEVVREIGDRLFVVPGAQMSDGKFRLHLRHKLLSSPLGSMERIAAEIRNYFQTV